MEKPLSQKKEPLAASERFIVQNIFDTQPKKRASYLKKLGYEMNPEDENQYRPIGATDQPYEEIDPGYGKAYDRGNVAGLVKEIGLDIGDIAIDLGVSGPLTTAAATYGAAGGGALGAKIAAIGGPAVATLGALAGAAGGGVAAGGAANFALEELKGAAADLLLDEKIPQDRSLQAVQSLIVGAAPIVMKGVVSGAKHSYKAILQQRSKAIQNAIGAGLSDDMVEVVAKNPEKFTKDKIENGVKNLSKTFKTIFGLDDPLKVDAPDNVSGMFRPKMDKLNADADVLIDQAALDETKNMSLDQFNAFIKKTVESIKGGRNSFELDGDSSRAISYLQTLKSEINKGLGSNMTKKVIIDGEEVALEGLGKDPSQIKLNFREQYNIAKRIQKDAFDLNENAPGSNILRKIVGSDGEGLKKILDVKVPALAKINADRHQLFNAYNFAVEKVNKNSVMNMYTGKDTVSKNQVREGLAAIDSQLGTKLTKEIEIGGIQSFVQNLFETSQNAGSKNINALMVSEGAVGAVKGAATGAGLGYMVGAPAAGGAVGAVTGAVKGASSAAKLADPETALKALLQARSENASFNPALRSVGAEVLAAGAAESAINSRNEAKPEQLASPEEDIWNDSPSPSPVPSPAASSIAPSSKDEDIWN